NPEYLDQSHIIHAPAMLGSIAADSYFFAPFDFPGNAMIAVLKAPGASDGESIRVVSGNNAVVETGPGGGFMVYVPLSGVDVADCANVHGKVQMGMDLSQNTSCSGNDVVPGFQKHLDASGLLAVGIVFVDSTNPADADAAAAALVT